MLWVEVAHTIVFLQNGLLKRTVKDHTPHKAWYDYKPSLNFLKIFGCLCFTHVPQNKYDKLDKRAPSCFSIGYSIINKSYKIFQLQTRSMVVVINVHFIKDGGWELG